MAACDANYAVRAESVRSYSCQSEAEENKPLSLLSFIFKAKDFQGKRKKKQSLTTDYDEQED